MGLLRKIGIWLCAPIYRTIINIYSIFYNLANARFFGQSSIIDDLSKNIYVFVSVVMLFVFSASLIAAIVNPEYLSKGKLAFKDAVKRALIGVILIVFIPTIFDAGYKLQENIVSNSTIERVLFGFKFSGNTNTNTGGNGGQVIAGSLLAGTLHYYDDVTQINNRAVADAYEQMISTQVDGNIDIVSENINIAPGNSNSVHEYAFEFEGLIALIAGGYTAYILLVYAIDMAVRMFNLALLELTAPIAIMAYIASGQVLKKWLTKLATTYIDVFVRIAAMGFYAFIVYHISDFIGQNMFAGVKWQFLLQIIIIVGALYFVSKLPEFINSAFGVQMSSNNSLRDRIRPTREILHGTRQALGITRQALAGATAAVTTVGAGAVGAFRNANRNIPGTAGHRNWRLAGNTLAGLGGGLLRIPFAAQRGWNTGNMTALGDEIQRYRNTHPDGSTFGGMLWDDVTTHFGLGTRLDRMNNRIARDNRLQYNGQFVTRDQLERIRNQYDGLQNYTQAIQDAVNRELDREDSYLGIRRVYQFTDYLGVTHQYRGQNFHQIAETIEALRESGPQLGNYLANVGNMVGGVMYTEMQAYADYHRDQNLHNQRIAQLENEVQQERINVSDQLIARAARGRRWAGLNAAHDDTNRQAATGAINTTQAILADPTYAAAVGQRTITDHATLEAMNTQATAENNTIRTQMDAHDAAIRHAQDTVPYHRAERNNQSYDAAHRDNHVHTTNIDGQGNYN